MFSVTGLKTAYMDTPIGLDLKEIPLSWTMEANTRGALQTAFQIVISGDRETVSQGIGICLDTGKIFSDRMHFLWKDAPLKSGKRYYWAVRIWNEQGAISDWSPAAWWEMGLLHPEDWKSNWAIPEQNPAVPVISGLNMKTIVNELDESSLYPCQLLRRRFTVSKPIAGARIYATARGLYELELNGEKVGDYKLSPECTPYDKYHQYQTYDITDTLHIGENVVGMHLAPGWWSGIIGLFAASCQYGSEIAGLMQMEITYQDGTSEKIVTDESFKSHDSFVRYAELYIGEKQISAGGLRSWSEPGFDDSCWTPVRCAPCNTMLLRGQNAPHIRVREEIAPEELIVTPKNECVIDFGRILAGYIRIRLTGKTGDMVRLHYTEQLDPHGNFSLNIPGEHKNQTDTYIFEQDEQIVFEPKFVYRGFRYVWIEGYSEELRPEDAVAVSLCSDMELSCSFDCSDPRLKKLHQNLVRTTTANMLSIPTDNPDRERGGWTGDAQMYMETACYHLDVHAFFLRWLKEMRLEQLANGIIPLVIPNWKSYERISSNSASGWGDACVIIPWILYQHYGDEQALEENYPMMTRWVEYVRTSAEQENEPPYDTLQLSPRQLDNYRYIWNTGYKYGDWLTPSVCVNEEGGFSYKPLYRPLTDFLSCCYYVYTAGLMEKIAQLLHKPEDARYYRSLSQRAKEACMEEMLGEDGTPADNLQGAKVLALAFGFVPEEKKKQVADDLVEMIHRNNGRMDTGFSSTAKILEVLLENKGAEAAYDLLLNSQMPSWLYEVEKGATGIWEAWQGIMPDGSVNMVSFIQPAAGSVGSWIYQNVLGISPLEPGFRKIRIKPEPDARLTHVSGSFRSVCGQICTAWKREDNRYTVTVRIPANTTAVVMLPFANADSVAEGGRPIREVREIVRCTQRGNKTEVEIGSGSYVFTYPEQNMRKE